MTIAYKPMTVRLPSWSTREARALMASADPKDKARLEELLDEIVADQGWVPGLDSVTKAVGRG
ncbi:MAG: hypothetical protein V4597_08325 [Pseudomonadota bacterium]